MTTIDQYRQRLADDIAALEAAKLDALPVERAKIEEQVERLKHKLHADEYTI